MVPPDLREQLRQDPRGHAAPAVALPAGADGVDLVEEDDAGRGGARLAEDVAHGPLAVAHILGEELGPLDGDEVHLGLRGHGLRHHGLGATRGPTITITSSNDYYDYEYVR